MDDAVVLDLSSSQDRKASSGSMMRSTLSKPSKELIAVADHAETRSH
jgi:hypothetical protein